MILSERQARAISANVLSMVQADSASVSITNTEERNIRFARNGATTNGARNILRISVTVNIGQRSGAATTTQPDAESLRAAVDQATATARIAPENAEFMPPLAQQTYAAPAGWHAASANANARRFADKLAPVVAAARGADVLAAGYLEGGATCTALANSAGLFVYDRRTDFDFTVTARTNDGTGSGWAGASHTNLNGIDATSMGRVAIDKAVRSRNAATLSPGRYTVVLEPSPAADLLGYLGFSMDARAADEGRSAFSKRGGGNRIGERVVGENVTVRSDPSDPLSPGPIYADDGLPHRPVTWIENGVLRALPTTRFWAQRSNTQALPRPGNFILEGGAKTTDELVRGVEHGILVTRFWYIRFVDPRTLVLTGLTRDGLFLIEGGEITRPVRNMRWNESPLAMLSNVVEFGRTIRARGTEQSGGIAAPPIVARDFTFSSVSEAV